MTWSQWSIYMCFLRGCLHDTGATFAPGRDHSSSLSWLYICLYDTTTKCHAGVRISLQYEILQRYHVNAKQLPVMLWNRPAGRLEQVAMHNVCDFESQVYFINMKCTFKFYDMKWPSHNVNAIRNKKVTSIWNSCWCEFSHVNNRLVWQ